MLEGCHANMSTFAQRKATSTSSYLAPRPLPMRAIWEGFAPICTIFAGTCSVLSGFVAPWELDGDASGLSVVFIFASRDPELMVGIPWSRASSSQSKSLNPSIAIACSFSRAATATGRSPGMVITPLGPGILMHRYP